MRCRWLVMLLLAGILPACGGVKQHVEEPGALPAPPLGGAASDVGGGVAPGLEAPPPVASPPLPSDDSSRTRSRKEPPAQPPERRAPGGGAAKGAAPAPPEPPAPLPAPSPEAPAAPEERTADQHVFEARNFLDRGDPEGARAELEAALRQDPGRGDAARLLKDLDADPVAALGAANVSYAVVPGDTLSKIAKKFLGDSDRFYILARYNGLRVPRDLEAGQVLRIPGKEPPGPQAPPKTPQTPKPTKPAKPAKPPPKAAGDDQTAEKLYQSGVQALAASPEKAYELFTQALRANPRHAGALEKLPGAKGLAVDAYYKRAMAAFSKQDLDSAMQYCDKALGIDPDSEKVKILRARTLDLSERFKKVQ